MKAIRPIHYVPDVPQPFITGEFPIAPTGPSIPHNHLTGTFRPGVPGPRWVYTCPRFVGDRRAFAFWNTYTRKYAMRFEDEGWTLADAITFSDFLAKVDDVHT